jgi:hypothetical protein
MESMEQEWGFNRPELAGKRIEYSILKKVFDWKNDPELLGVDVAIERCEIEAFICDDVVLIDVVDNKTKDKMYFRLDDRNSILIGDIRTYELEKKEKEYLKEKAMKKEERMATLE